MPNPARRTRADLDFFVSISPASSTQIWSVPDWQNQEITNGIKTWNCGESIQ